MGYVEKKRWVKQKQEKQARANVYTKLLLVKKTGNALRNQTMSVWWIRFSEVVVELIP